ncbi:ABC transporter ATP-binding protein [Rodentibacter genomosp. 2]|uniref:ABC transporter ATP-binding protein n=1 Tax=Rodentibacter genomosp. 2 TaxID=1908266 RepID=A0A1V3JKM4_9PAST|nr:ABC transporter ATP-binding protein [Rodentibacter genomosp. 2]OOF56812.1 ABC transporter ATP-binding protein [Rodentibacter genomosp. 2]
MNKVLTVENLGFYYQAEKFLFHQLNFDLQQGDILAILGQNGCGKSTLLDLLLGIHHPIQGNIEVHQSICFVPQFFSSPFAYSVLDIVLMGRTKHINTFAKPKAYDYQVAMQALDYLNLTHLVNREFVSLSGGQRQLILIARAIASECKLMLLDEPTSALDLANQNVVLSLLQDLAKHRNMTIIFTTHQPNHATAVANKTLLMIKDDIQFGETVNILTAGNLTALFHLSMLEQQVKYQQSCFKHFVPLYGTLLNKKD